MGTIYMSLNRDDLKKIDEMSAITEIDYGIKDNLVLMETYKDIAEDLLYEYRKLEEEFEDYKQDVEDNYEYIGINPYKEYGVSEHDFH